MTVVIYNIVQKIVCLTSPLLQINSLLKFVVDQNALGNTLNGYSRYTISSIYYLYSFSDGPLEHANYAEKERFVNIVKYSLIWEMMTFLLSDMEKL